VSANSTEQSVARRGVGERELPAEFHNTGCVAGGRRRHRRQQLRKVKQPEAARHGRRLWKSQALRLPRPPAKSEPPFHFF
jgi:hypothetical protein